MAEKPCSRIKSFLITLTASCCEFFSPELLQCCYQDSLFPLSPPYNLLFATQPELSSKKCYVTYLLKTFQLSLILFRVEAQVLKVAHTALYHLIPIVLPIFHSIPVTLASMFFLKQTGHILASGFHPWFSLCPEHCPHRSLHGLLISIRSVDTFLVLLHSHNTSYLS